MSPVPGGRSMSSTSRSPEHVGQELLQRAMEHRPAPHDGVLPEVNIPIEMP